jgi:hypothetical protein
MPYISTDNHLPKKDAGKFREWEFCPNINPHPSMSPPSSCEDDDNDATSFDSDDARRHHRP